ncbi:transposase domain-containing protein [Lactimicrobium massiliense]|uniref:transposase domain-containing protein n=1 Tax=Lactimicrobium massiliense TaxID=2161814 RepID=UPI00107F3E6B
MLIDTPKGAEASAGIYSIVETAKANGLKLYPYFTHLLEEIPKIINGGSTEIPESLMPWSQEAYQKPGM